MAEGKETAALSPDRVAQWSALKDFKNIALESLPSPKEDWDLIWVFSGSHGFERGSRVRSGAGGEIITLEKGVVNETRSRFLTAVGLARQVAGLRIGKSAEGVTLEDLRKNAPTIYFNGWDWQNDALRDLFEKGDGEKEFNFPGGKLEIAPSGSQIEHTGHQFKKFPKELLPEGKVVLVSDFYHLPRIKRYAWKWFNRSILGRMVFYASQPIVGSFKRFREELRKIAALGKIGQKEDLVWFPPKDEK